MAKIKEFLKQSILYTLMFLGCVFFWIVMIIAGTYELANYHGEKYGERATELLEVIGAAALAIGSILFGDWYRDAKRGLAYVGGLFQATDEARENAARRYNLDMFGDDEVDELLTLCKEHSTEVVN